MAGLLVILPFRLQDSRRPKGLIRHASWKPKRAQLDFIAALRQIAATLPRS